ncbi:MAG: hypothetical protein ACKOXB_03725 [Flavobacteriales bacterium]
MPRKSSSKLHELIHSLTKAEKRHFKLHASFAMKNSEDKQFFRLFDILEKAKSYDEEKVIAQLPDVKEFFVIKNVLYNSILKSLSALYTEKSPRMFTRSKLSEIEVLFRKGLYKQGHKQIEQTKKKAEQNEQFETLLQLINMEQKLLVSAMSFKSLKSYKERIRVLMDETKKVLIIIENIKEYDSLVLPITRLHFEGAQYQQKQDLHYLQELMKNELLQSENKALSKRALLNFHYIWGVYYKLIHHKEKALPYFQKRLNLFEETAVFKEELFADYLSTLQLATELAANQPQLAEEWLKKLTQLYSQKESLAPEQQTSLFIYFFLASVEYCKNKGDYKAILKQEETIKEGINVYQEQINAGLQQELMYYIGYAYFALGKFAQSKLILKQIIENKSTGIKSDIFNLANILYLLCLYETEEHSLVKSVAKSWLKSLDKENVYHEIDAEIIYLVIKLIGVEKTRTRRQYYDFRDYLMSRQFELEHLKLYKYFDVFAWLEGKIHGKTIAEHQKQAV